MNRRVSGFTLVEVVIALAVLAVAFFGLISVITYTTRMNMATKERMLAMRAAEKKIEQMLACVTLEDIYNTFHVQAEGQGWEQVEGLQPLKWAGYPATNGPVLFVRFPRDKDGNDTGVFCETATAKWEGTAKFMDNKDENGNFKDLDLNRNGTTGAGTQDTEVSINNCKILPVRVEVYWKGTVGPGQGNPANGTNLVYRYTFIRKS